MKKSINTKEKYSVGALLYSPALNPKIADTVIKGVLGNKYSLALCLEDTISSDQIEAALIQLKETFQKIHTESLKNIFYLPKIFVRVRFPEQISTVYELLKDYQSILTGFIFPKYSHKNADEYNQKLIDVNNRADHLIYMMPILESSDIIDFRYRKSTLLQIKEDIDSVKDYVLNVRVGGNDFSNEFATRRHYDETIYDILPIAQLFGDILTVFSREYVVSGPVWEYFSSENDEWKTGLCKELKLDRLNGFIGKTVIHPKQIAVVNDMLKVSKKDYEDAKTILNWDESGLQVGKSVGGERMNEVRTNCNWAEKIMILAEIYGVKKNI